MKKYLVLGMILSLVSALAQAIPPYERDTWKHWIDQDGDCQDTRQEILVRDTRRAVTWEEKRKCKVVTGQWFDPYTGKFFREASQLDIDHVVSLKHAHESGGHAWSSLQKSRFANDFENLVAVEAGINRSKGEQGVLTWMPPRQEFWCSYVKKWKHIKLKYRLDISSAEGQKIQRMLERCQVN